MQPSSLIWTGLLLDSERLGQQSYMAACEQMGVVVDIPLYLRCVGCNAVRTRQMLLAGYGDANLVGELREIWVEEYAARTKAQPVPLKPGVLPLLRWLQSQSMPLAVATSTAQDQAQLKLAKAGIRDFFRFVIGGDQVLEGKPAPDIYRSAARELGFESGLCLALEDSENGVRAAVAAGMTVIQVPDLVEPGPELVALGHQIRPSLMAVLAQLHKGTVGAPSSDSGAADTRVRRYKEAASRRTRGNDSATGCP